MASPLPITVATFSTGVYVDVNPAWERFFHYRKQDVLGKTSIDLGFWNDMRDRQGWIDRFNADGRVSDYEVTFKMRDGSPRVFMISSERFMYGNEECVLTMSVDVTTRKQLEADLKSLNASLEQRVEDRTRALDQSHHELIAAMDSLQLAQEELVQSEKLASLGSMVAGVAHELNTPLGNAMVTASTMSADVKTMRTTLVQGSIRKSELDSFMHRMSEGVDLTQRSVARAVALVSSFKQVAVDQASERRREFDLAQVVHEVMDTLRPSIKRNGITLEVEISSGIQLESFPGPLGQVLMNLVTNAVTHAFDGRNGGRILVSAAMTGLSELALTVQDDGAGIAQHHLGQIFDPFFTTRLGQGGSGLGLSISHRIVTKVLGGQIAVSSAVGQGARFELSLPINAPSFVH
jgi:PAS domain S-box-containing protein